MAWSEHQTTPVEAVKSLIHRLETTLAHKIPPERLRAIAKICAAARLAVTDFQESENSAAREIGAIKAEFQGGAAGSEDRNQVVEERQEQVEEDRDQVEKAHAPVDKDSRRGRQACQHVYESSGSLLSRIAAFHKMYGDAFDSLPSHIRSRFPVRRITVMERMMRKLHEAAELRDPFVLGPPMEVPTVSQLTFLWLAYYLPEYPEKWEHIYYAAYALHLTKAQSDSFERYIRELTTRAAQRGQILACPDWATQHLPGVDE